MILFISFPGGKYTIKNSRIPIKYVAWLFIQPETT